VNEIAVIAVLADGGDDVEEALGTILTEASKSPAELQLEDLQYLKI
jgi:hypothetical protein